MCHQHITESRVPSHEPNDYTLQLGAEGGQADILSVIPPHNIEVGCPGCYIGYTDSWELKVAGSESSSSPLDFGTPRYSKELHWRPQAAGGSVDTNPF